MEKINNNNKRGVNMKKFNGMAEKELLATMAAYYEYKLSNSTTTVFTTPGAVSSFAAAKIGTAETEQFLVIFTDNRNKLIKAEVLFSGTVNKTVVYPREIFKRALELNALAIIISHNHPSGSLTPSKQDVALTKQIKDGAELMQMRLIDHIIVNSTGQSKSFVESGLI
jgi:DNA repair protein RadC